LDNKAFVINDAPCNHEDHLPSSLFATSIFVIQKIRFIFRHKLTLTS